MAGFFGSTRDALGGSPLSNLSNWDIASLGASGLQDAYAAYRGQQGGSLDSAMDTIKTRTLSQSANDARKAIADAGSDPTKLKQAILSYTALGGDPSSLISALKFGQPEIKTFDQTQDVYSVDPLTGSQTLVRHGVQKPTPNQPFNPDGTPNAAYQSYQKELYRARAQANADFRAPPKPDAGGVPVRKGPF